MEEPQLVVDSIDVPEVSKNDDTTSAAVTTPDHESNEDPVITEPSEAPVAPVEVMDSNPIVEVASSDSSEISSEADVVVDRSVTSSVSQDVGEEVEVSKTEVTSAEKSSETVITELETEPTESSCESVVEAQTEAEIDGSRSPSDPINNPSASPPEPSKPTIGRTKSYPDPKAVMEQVTFFLSSTLSLSLMVMNLLL